MPRLWLLLVPRLRSAQSAIVDGLEQPGIVMDLIDQNVAENFARFEKNHDPTLVHAALETIEAAERNVPIDDKAARRLALSRRLNFFAALDRNIDPEWDASDLPVQGVQPLPDIAKRISGKEYLMQDNPPGWKKITFNFEEGKQEAQSIVVAQQSGDPQTTETVSLGMDNVYRMEKLEGGSFIARRCYWADDHTLVVSQLQSAPQLEETEIRVAFSGNKLKVHVEEKVFGNYTFDFEGTLA